MPRQLDKKEDDPPHFHPTLRAPCEHHQLGGTQVGDSLDGLVMGVKDNSRL